MAIPSRQIGWGTQDNLLWQIAKQLEGASCQLCTLNDNITTITGTSGTSGSSGVSGTSGKYGSFYSTQDQSLAKDAVGSLTFNNTDLSNGVSIVSNSRITIANTGVYNLQFSAQIHHIGGGGSGETINVWFSKNGVDIADSNTRYTVTSSTKYSVAALNFFVNASAGDYYEIVWSTDNANIIIEYEPAGAHPAIPSVILTVNQIGI
jgi:hypothetical protein